MQYRVISAFNDLLDGGFLYKVGDEYPRQGTQTNENRIAELSSDINKLKKPLIQKVEESESESESADTDMPMKKRRKRYENS